MGVEWAVLMIPQKAAQLVRQVDYPAVAAGVLEIPQAGRVAIRRAMTGGQVSFFPGQARRQYQVVLRGAAQVDLPAARTTATDHQDGLAALGLMMMTTTYHQVIP